MFHDRTECANSGKEQRSISFWRVRRVDDLEAYIQPFQTAFDASDIAGSYFNQVDRLQHCPVVSSFAVVLVSFFLNRSTASIKRRFSSTVPIEILTRPHKWSSFLL